MPPIKKFLFVANLDEAVSLGKAKFKYEKGAQESKALKFFGCISFIKCAKQTSMFYFK